MPEKSDSHDAFELAAIVLFALTSIGGSVFFWSYVSDAFEQGFRCLAGIC